MPGITKVRTDVYREFAKYAMPAKLSADGRKAQKEIFDVTIGRFVKDAAKAKVDVWKRPKFKSFILGQTKRIAKAASQAAKAGVIDYQLFYLTSSTIMRRTHKWCKLAIQKGRITDVRKGHYSEHTAEPGAARGMVCSGFLQGQDIG